MVGREPFGDLGTDGHRRVERGHRLLEDHGDAAAAMAAHCLLRQRKQIFAAKRNLSGDMRRVRKQAQDGQRGDGLAGAGLADQSQRFAGIDVKGDVPDCGLGDRGLGAEGDAEAANIEQRRRGVDGFRHRSHGSGIVVVK